jgi:hypothetical protein
MVQMKKWICISFFLLAIAAMSIVHAAAQGTSDLGEGTSDIGEGTPNFGEGCAVINVQSGASITLTGSPGNTVYYYFSWSSEGFVMRKDGVALTTSQLGAQSITFDAPVAPGKYKVQFLVGQKGTSACIDTYCVQIVVTKQPCFTTTPYCEEGPQPVYCYAGRDNTGNTYKWYVYPLATTSPGPGEVPLGTSKCFTFPAQIVHTGDIFNDYYVTLVVTDLNGQTTCGPIMQRVLEDPTAGINVGGGQT